MISLGGTEALGFPGQVAWDAHGETTKRSTVRRWDGWIMGRTPAARRCNALVRECRGFMSGLTLKVGGLSPSHLGQGPLELLCAFADFSQHSQISSALALSGLLERVVLKSHRRGQDRAGVRDGQRGARRFVVKYRVGRSGVDRCVRGVCVGCGLWIVAHGAAMGHAAGF